MAETRIGSEPYFQRGISSIVDAPAPADALLLAGQRELAPSALAHPAALDELLSAENLESMLQDAVRPELADRELLGPQRFRAAMDNVLALFERTADARRSANPRMGKVLDGAAQVLAEEIELRELLQMYRGALLQG